MRVIAACIKCGYVPALSSDCSRIVCKCRVYRDGIDAWNLENKIDFGNRISLEERVSRLEELVKGLMDDGK